MRIYDAPFGFTAETVAVDIVELTPADDKPIVIIRTMVGQSTEVGDAQEEFIPIAWIRGNTSSGSGGVAAAAPNTRNPSDATAGFTYEALNTTPSSSGTTKTLAQYAWSVRGGLDMVHLPEERPEASQGNTLMCLRLGAAPVDSITIGGCIVVGESG
jgi:hypothetical protein